jgi:hypothetical protein
MVWVGTPLRPLGEGVRDRVLVSAFTPVEVPDEVAEAAISARERIQAPIVVPNETPTRLHPFAQALRQAFRSAKPDEEGFLRVGGSGVLSAAIGPANRDRAVMLVDPPNASAYSTTSTRPSGRRFGNTPALATKTSEKFIHRPLLR